MEALERPFISIESVVEGLSDLEDTLRERRDRRAIFATAYLNMTKEVSARVGDAAFRDPEWVGRYALSFANLYRTAFLSFENGDLDSVPACWRLSFETSRAARGLLIQDLVLGVNAHINHDLALALVDASIDPQRDKRRTDHFAVNAAIKKATDPIQKQLTSLYAPVLRLLDDALGRLDEDVTNFSIEKARLNAWVSAISLAGARGDMERKAVLESISDRATLLANVILKPSVSRRALTLIHRLERMNPWWERLPPH